eukprot:4841835-Heterocapsa_arctica.AAC.1
MAHTDCASRLCSVRATHTECAKRLCGARVRAVRAGVLVADTTHISERRRVGWAAHAEIACLFT